MSKAILTDIGNVLVFNDPLRVAHHLSRHLGRPLEQINETLSSPEGAALIAAFETGQIAGEGYVTGLEELFRAPLTRSVFWTAHLNNVATNDRIVTLFRELASSSDDIRLVAVTDVDVMRLDDALQRCRLPFRGVVASYTVGFLKPHPLMYETALEKADLPPSDCFFVDDMEANVRAATKLGIRAHRYADPDELIRAISAFIVGS